MGNVEDARTSLRGAGVGGTLLPAMNATLPCPPVRIRNIAHRGLWNALVPQNTLEAFRRAWAAGATWVETDFHHTHAGQMICIHGEHELRHYTGCEKHIADLSPTEVATLSLAPDFREASPVPGTPGFRIPLLDEVLATVPPHGTLQAEIKGYSPDYADLFDEAVRAAGLTEANIVVSSFQPNALADFHARKPSYRTLLLVAVPRNREVDVAAEIERCRDAGFDAFCPGLDAGSRPLTPAEAEAVRAAGLSFRVYGVNTPAALNTARDLRAEAFTCNFWRDAFDWAASLGGTELLA